MAIELPKLRLTKGTIFEKLVCDHEYREVGKYKKLKCHKCGKEIFVREESEKKD